MTKKQSFVDMDSIRDIGLEKFSEIYYWPISDAEYKYFVDTILIEFESVLFQADREIFDLVIADYRFLVFIIQHIHYKAALSRFGINIGHSTTFGPSLNSMLQPDWNSYVQYFSQDNFKTGHFGNYRNTLKSQIGGRLRHIYNTVECNKNHSLFEHVSQLCVVPEHISIGPLTPFKKLFLPSQDDYIKVSEWSYYGLPNSLPEDNFKSRLRNQFLDPYLNFLSKQSQTFGAAIDKTVVLNAWGERLFRLAGFYYGYKAAKNFPKKMLITAAGNPIRKVLATAMQRQGTDIYVLHHGECPGVERYPHAHRNDGSFCDYFVCPTPQIADNFRSNYSDSLLEKRAGTKYISCNATDYKDRYQQYRSVRSSGVYKTIMLIGYGMNHTRYLDGAGYFSYFQMDVQYRVAKLIKKNGYRLIYKVHPDRSAEVGDLFTEISDDVERRPFEEVWDTADGYVFTYPGTTVFGGAVMTDKPMLLVDLFNNNWNDSGYQLLRLRCNMVASAFDSSNRILFDEGEFSEKLNDPLPLDDSYIKQAYPAISS